MATAQDRGEAGGTSRRKVCIVGASGKLGQYMVQHALDRGYEVVGVCREKSVRKLDRSTGGSVMPGATTTRGHPPRGAGCDAMLTVLVPRGVHGYSSGTARRSSTMRPGARLVFSCGWHITRDGQEPTRGRSRWS